MDSFVTQLTATSTVLQTLTDFMYWQRDFRTDSFKTRISEAGLYILLTGQCAAACFQWGSVPLRSHIKGTELPRANMLFTKN